MQCITEHSRLGFLSVAVVVVVVLVVPVGCLSRGRDKSFAAPASDCSADPMKKGSLVLHHAM